MNPLNSLTCFLLVCVTMRCSLPAFGSPTRVPRTNEVQPVHIPLQVNNQQYAVTLAMSSGPNVQNLVFSLSMATGYTIVAGKYCDSCGVQSYDPSSSSSAHSIPGKQDVSLWSNRTSGNIVTEDCHLARTDGSPWSYANQTIIVANQSQTIVRSFGLSGVFGLGTNGRDGKFDESLMGNWLSKHPGSTHFSYGLALNSPYTSSSQRGGELHLLAPDPKAFTGEITWKNMSTFGPDERDSDWYIELDSWSFMSGRSGQLRRKEVRAVMDPFLAPMRFPSSNARAIFSTVPGAKSSNFTSPGAIIWEVPCDSKMVLTFSYGGFAVSMDEEILIRRVEDRCVSHIEEWANPSTDIHALGSIFIAEVYIVFSASSSSEGTVGVASRADKGASVLSTGKIIGVVFGGLILVIAAVIAAIFVSRWSTRRPSTKEKPLEPHHPSCKFPIDCDPPSTHFPNPYPCSPVDTEDTLTSVSPSPTEESTASSSSHHSRPLFIRNVDSPPAYIN